MDYRKIMCGFCENCTEMKINQKVIKSTDCKCSDVLVIKCVNFCPKYHFKDKSNNNTEIIALFV